MKICSQFLDFALAFGEEDGGEIVITEKLTQDKIGALSGLHRVTVSKELKSLRELGLIRVVDGYYRIKSLSALMDYCDEYSRRAESEG